MTGATEEATLKDPKAWRTLDVEGDSEVVILDETTPLAQHKKTFVRLMLIDWASTFELAALSIDDNASIEPLSDAGLDPNFNILVIGDSISCGFAAPVEEGGELVPFGVLQAFPLVAQRLLMEREPSTKVAIDQIAYPGWTLVSPTEQDKEMGSGSTGMADAFFRVTPWSQEVFDGPYPAPKAIILELGTNDQAFEVSVERFASTLKDLIENLIGLFQSSLRHIWLVPPFPDADTDNRALNLAYSAYIPRFEARFGDMVKVCLCDLVEGLTIADTVDGVHPSLSAHKAIGKKLADFLATHLD
ncbi:SGNH hydrolase-type esterase domain-containing protein [Crassisporium funariophilum]|nr:SGNH hydrolase-type esterase domain-containing protein [Crassisporium funariophilum]